ncbi:hypothetical protein BDI4_380117 [Burkholderia diffusa]|nr:hypothetical protein BDI4_380117 [Burkholderia diffusa]
MRSRRMNRIVKAIHYFFNIASVNGEWTFVLYLNLKRNRVDRFDFRHSRTMRTRPTSMRAVRQPPTSRLRRLHRFSGTI